MPEYVMIRCYKKDAMLITTAFSLFFLFWSLLFLIDFYLRTTQNENYMSFVEKRGFSVSPLQIRFYVSRHEDSNAYSSLLFMKSWSSLWSKRALRLLLSWFSMGAFVGLLCFIVTPLYLTWLLLIELSNVLTVLRWRSNGHFDGFHPMASALHTPLTPVEQEDVNFKSAISDLNTLENSLFYVPLQEHVQTGITPVIPGVNIPWSHLPMFMFVLVLAGVFHELGHAIAAINANVRLNGFGVFIFAVYPGAFTELKTEELSRSSSAQKMRIFSAGIWHNIILALIGVLILWSAPVFFMPFYKSGNGVLVTDVSEKSGLYGLNGFQPGHIVTQINQCKVHNSTEWTQCLERMHIKQQNLHRQTGYLVQYSKVLPLTASPEKVIDTTQSGEVQCCSEFSNVTLSSHICFRYYQTLSQIFKPLMADPKYKNQKSLVEDRNAALAEINIVKEKKSVRLSMQGATTPALSFAESFGIVKNRIKRANILPKPNFELPKDEQVKSVSRKEQVKEVDVRPDSFAKVMDVKTSVNILKNPATLSLARHACLPARQITDHAACEQMNSLNVVKKVPSGYICVVPALYNGTALLRFELKNRSRPVLFIGFLSEPLYMVDLMDITPRSDWIPFWFPQVIKLFGKYLVTFSLAMALLNAVPCYGLDGQYMCQTVVDYLYIKKLPEQRQQICNIVVSCGTAVFCLNVLLGFIKFLFNYWK